MYANFMQDVNLTVQRLALPKIVWNRMIIRIVWGNYRAFNRCETQQQRHVEDMSAVFRHKTGDKAQGLEAWHTHTCTCAWRQCGVIDVYIYTHCSGFAPSIGGSGWDGQTDRQTDVNRSAWREKKMLAYVISDSPVGLLAQLVEQWVQSPEMLDRVHLFFLQTYHRQTDKQTGLLIE